MSIYTRIIENLNNMDERDYKAMNKELQETDIEKINNALEEYMAKLDLNNSWHRARLRGVKEFIKIIYNKKTKSTMKDKAKFANKILLEYANENGINGRDTTDLSPLETWLILRLFVCYSAEEAKWKQAFKELLGD